MQRRFTVGPFLGMVLGLGLTSAAFATTLIDRGLPSSNLNNAAGADRSNVTWDFGAGILVGDDLTFSNYAIVDSITVYSVANGEGPGAAPINEFNGFTLYYGGVNTLTLSATSYTVQLVTYAGGLNYEGQSGGTFYDIYALTFTGLNFSVDPNSVYGFALAASPKGNNTLALHASNAALSGTPQDGADGLFSGYDATTLNLLGQCDSGNSSCGNIWDKSSDINVKVEGTVVPEPASLSLIGLGIGSLILMARKRLTNLG